MSRQSLRCECGRRKERGPEACSRCDRLENETHYKTIKRQARKPRPIRTDGVNVACARFFRSRGIQPIPFNPYPFSDDDQ